MTLEPPQPFAAVRLDSVAGEGDVVIKVELNDANGQPPDYFDVILGYHDRVASGWCASVPCREYVKGCGWTASVSIRGAFPRLIEVTSITARWTGRSESLDPNPRLHLEPEQPGEWRTGAQASDALTHVAAEREDFFAQALTAPGTEANKSTPFSAVMVADNVHLTAPHRVPGLAILPLTQASLGMDIAVVLADVMPKLGYQYGVDLPAWLSMVQRRNPAAIVHAPLVLATSPAEAIGYVSQQTHRLLDITAWRRGARPRLLGGLVIETIEGDEDGAAKIYTFVESRGYTGNQLGGLISGEDPDYLLAVWDITQSDPRAQLWLSLYADSLSENRPDYQFFRAFNLLEAIASEVLPRKQVIVNNLGEARLMSNGRTYTTDEARGKIFNLLRRVAQITQYSLSSFITGSPIPSADNADVLWDEVDVWVKIRNTVAHRGTWRQPDDDPPDDRRQALNEKVASFSPIDSVPTMGFDSLLGTVRRASELTLLSVIGGQL